MGWRIVRILINSVVSDIGCELREVDIRNAGVSVLNGSERYDKASASQYYAGALFPWRAFDGSTGTTWATEFTSTWPQWLQYDFGVDTVDFDEITITPENVARAPLSFKVFVSQDGLNFTEIASYTGLSSGWNSSVARSFSGLVVPPAPPLPSYTAPTIAHQHFQFSSDQTSITVPKPSGLANGDVLIVAIGIGQGAGTVITPPSGWTMLEFQRQSNEMAGLYYRVVSDAGSEPSTYAFTTDVARRAAGTVYKVTGADTLDPIIDSDFYKGDSGNPHFAPNLTNDTVGALLICQTLGGYGSLAISQDSGNGLTSVGSTTTTPANNNGITTIGGYRVMSVGGWTWPRGIVFQSNIDRVAFSVLVRPRAMTSIVQELNLAWAIELQKTISLQWSIDSAIVSQTINLLWSIDIQKSLGLSWQIGETPYEDWFAERWIYGAFLPGQTRIPVNINRNTATDYPAYVFMPTVEPVPIPTPELPPVVGVNWNYFYGDYYFRIWADPRNMRLTNPRIGAPLYFALWNAYPDANLLTDVTLTSLPGVELLFEVPVDFKGYEYKRLAFEITEDAPVRLDGNIHFEFTYGEAEIDLQAIVVDALRHIPNWTIQETWSWATTVNVAETGKEQRISNRLAPRYGLSLDIQLPDDMDRRLQYRQLWTFISRTLRIPQWQYMTPITSASAAGDDRIYFEPLATDLRIGEYAALIHPMTREILLVRISSFETNGATLDVNLDTDIGAGWHIAPTVAMRMPDGTSIAMNAVEGTASVNFESVQLRDMLTNDDVTLVTFEDIVLLHHQPVVQSSENESFAQKTEVLDNVTSIPQLTTFWPSPKVSIRRSWLIEDRQTEIHYWRKFCKHVNGMQKAFYMPTWRHDLELTEQPTLGSLQIKVLDPDYAFQWDNETYKRIQIRTRNGVVYRRVINIDDTGSNGYTLTLNAGLGSAPGDNEINMISFLNLVRLNSDDVMLIHDENYSIINLSLITVNA